jgi:hypothetical protein
LYQLQQKPSSRLAIPRPLPMHDVQLRLEDIDRNIYYEIRVGSGEVIGSVWDEVMCDRMLDLTLV